MASSYGIGVFVLVLMCSGAMASNCATVTVNNVLNIGTCLGSSLDYCTSGGVGLVNGLVKLLRCLLTGVFYYGSPDGVVTALGPLIQLVANRFLSTSLNLGPIGTLALCDSNTCINFFDQSDTCQGPIQLVFPPLANIGSCAGDVAQVCTAGSPTTTNDVDSLVTTIYCILDQLPADQLDNVLRGILCDLSAGLSDIQASVDVQLRIPLATFTAALKGYTFPQCRIMSG
ncbi:uncharacterized protein LOC144141497 [Haemaphysalis longicornis]